VRVLDLFSGIVEAFLGTGDNFDNFYNAHNVFSFPNLKKRAKA
jgi:hypothetical protein